MVSAGHSVISGHPHSRYGVDPLPKAFKLEPKSKMFFFFHRGHSKSTLTKRGR